MTETMMFNAKPLLLIVLTGCVFLNLEGKEKSTTSKKGASSSNYQHVETEDSFPFETIRKKTSPWIGEKDMLIVRDRNNSSSLIVQVEEARFDRDGDNKIGKATLRWVLLTEKKAETGFVELSKKFLKEKVKVVKKTKEGTSISYRYSEDTKDLKIGNFKINWSMRGENKVYIYLLHKCSYAVVRYDDDEEEE